MHFGICVISHFFICFFSVRVEARCHGELLAGEFELALMVRQPFQRVSEFYLGKYQSMYVYFLHVASWISISSGRVNAVICPKIGEHF